MRAVCACSGSHQVTLSTKSVAERASRTQRGGEECTMRARDKLGAETKLQEKSKCRGLCAVHVNL